MKCKRCKTYVAPGIDKCYWCMVRDALDREGIEW